jgi:hypothetical protein
LYAVKFNLPFNLTVDLVALADMPATASVTAHVLVRTRNVRAAIGRMGVAWLSPIIGPILYYFFVINRVARLAPRMVRREPSGAGATALQDDTQLQDNIRMIAHVGDRLTGHPLAMLAGRFATAGSTLKWPR